ncbi:MAG: HEPN domain-containing protein [Trueperaceae bacterium]|nr:HEPN domain-containing protein [Trueperaceae bacterium]
MFNRRLATDYLRRAGARLLAIDALFEAESWADVVRESQEVVELALKALLRVSGVEPPRVHDVSDVLEEAQDSLPASILPHLAQLTSASRRLRRDRELAFYGAEDLTPSEFYSRADAGEARVAARNVVSLVERFAFPSEAEA